MDHLLSIHAFDASLFRGGCEGLPVTFVGNSALTVDFSEAKPARLRKQIGAAADDPILIVLPGSRPGEIERMLPPFEDAVRRLKETHPGLQVGGARGPGGGRNGQGPDRWLVAPRPCDRRRTRASWTR